MGEEADWRGLHSLPAGSRGRSARDVWARLSKLSGDKSDDVPEDAETERGRPDGARPGPEARQAPGPWCRRAIGCAGGEPSAGNEPGPEPAPDSQPEDGAQEYASRRAPPSPSSFLQQFCKGRGALTADYARRCGQALRPAGRRCLREGVEDVECRAL